ncbi:hypothetical protein BN1184_AR_01380 [Pantoea ananatis]|nr:hypothetical protein BN1184_AR_01380 [Pantoea ananatis]
MLRRATEAVRHDAAPDRIHLVRKGKVAHYQWRQRVLFVFRVSASASDIALPGIADHNSA